MGSYVEHTWNSALVGDTVGSTAVEAVKLNRATRHAARRNAVLMILTVVDTFGANRRALKIWQELWTISIVKYSRVNCTVQIAYKNQRFERCDIISFLSQQNGRYL